MKTNQKAPKCPNRGLWKIATRRRILRLLNLNRKSTFDKTTVIPPKIQIIFPLPSCLRGLCYWGWTVVLLGLTTAWEDQLMVSPSTAITPHSELESERDPVVVKPPADSDMPYTGPATQSWETRLLTFSQHQHPLQHARPHRPSLPSPDEYKQVREKSVIYRNICNGLRSY